MDQVSLRAQAGRKPGSRESRRLRREGLVPAIVYGADVKDPIAVSVDAHDLQTALRTEAGSNAIINLEIEDGKASPPWPESSSVTLSAMSTATSTS